MLLQYEKQAARHISHTDNIVSSADNQEGRHEWAAMNKTTHTPSLKQSGSPHLPFSPLECTVPSAPGSAGADAEEQHPAR